MKISLLPRIPTFPSLLNFSCPYVEFLPRGEKSAAGFRISSHAPHQLFTSLWTKLVFEGQEGCLRGPVSISQRHLKKQRARRKVWELKGCPCWLPGLSPLFLRLTQPSWRQMDLKSFSAACHSGWRERASFPRAHTGCHLTNRKNNLHQTEWEGTWFRETEMK